jgi:hypothetical protein
MIKIGNFLNQSLLAGTCPYNAIDISQHNILPIPTYLIMSGRNMIMGIISTRHHLMYAAVPFHLSLNEGSFSINLSNL